MSSSSRLLRKLRKFMSVGVASASLVACSSQISRAGAVYSFFLPDVSVDNIRFKFNKFTSRLSIYGNGELTNKVLERANISLIDDSVRSVVIYGNVEIGNRAFWFFPALEEIEILGRITRIGSCAFTGCYSLGHIVIPSSVVEIGSDAFKGCKNLENVTFLRPTSYNSALENSALVAKGRFRYKNAKVVGAKLRSLLSHEWKIKIGDGAFDNCPKLSKSSKMRLREKFGYNIEY